MARKGQTLTLKERRFINAYMGTARGNATQAAKEAGYRGTQRSLEVTGSRLLRKAEVKTALDARVEKKDSAAILDADARDALLSEIAKKKAARNQDRIAAVKELNKVSGRHSMTLHHKGKMTMEVLAEMSRNGAEAE